MDRDTHTRLKIQARIIKAMAHPTRLFIVEKLSRGTRCVCELTEMVGADISTVFKYLTVLTPVSFRTKNGAPTFFILCGAPVY